MQKTNKSNATREIESLLRHYKQYLVSIENIKEQLEYIMPSITTNYEPVEGSAGTFVIISKTENYAIDRIESKRALNLSEEKKKNEIIVRSIDRAVGKLEEKEQEFIKCRYYNNYSLVKTADEMGYSESYLHKIRSRVMRKLEISLSKVLDF